MEYKVTNILSKDEIACLCKIYDMLNPYSVARYFNLVSLMRADVPQQYENPEWVSIKNKLNQHYPDANNSANYFLKYVEGSFCTLHADSPNKVKQTSITLIDKTPDLIGGEILLKKERFSVRPGCILPTDENILKHGEDKGQPLMKKMKPIMTVQQNIGETIWYPANIQHGVSYVSRGYRLVLIQWYK